MKSKLLGLFLFAMILNGCDDGDITVETIDFSEVEADFCGNIIYKIKESEAVFFELGEPGAFEQAFRNIPTEPGNPLVYNVSAANRIFYRAYDGTVTSDNFCTPIPPINPNVTEEWTVSSGRIEVATTVVKIPNTDAGFSGGEKIQKFRHDIEFKDIVWERPNGADEVQETYEFGSFDTYPNPNIFDFNFDDALDKCDASYTIYNFFGREALTLTIAPALIANEVTPLGTPRIGYLDAGNILKYSFYNPNDPTLVSAANFCSGATTPAVIETWLGVDGVEANMTGRIEVTTTTSGPGVFLHEIHLKKVTFKNGNIEFLLADDYLLGYLTTTE